MSKKPALGRGLGSILPTDMPAEKPLTSEIPLSQIELNPFQPRKDFEPVALEELADSIRVHGIIQPLTVRKLSDRQYQLISGERRLRASRLAGLENVPAYVRTANDEQMLEMALIENIQREDLNPIEIALSYQRMIDELGLKQDELGEKVGKQRSTVTNYLSLLRLPDTVLIAVREGKISMGHAKALLSLDDPILQLRVLNIVIEKELSVRKTEELVRTFKQPAPKPASKPEAPSLNQIHLKKVAEQLEDKFGNRVRLSQQQGGQGEIVIAFDSVEDLNRILGLLDM
ncbi:MAG: ParB/RepB/Spo0J family partition protein [Bacteroidia bacterium]|nr:ParB/RepB/Spo0J family partition protein [Bacteroidia bacterium]